MKLNNKHIYVFLLVANFCAFFLTAIGNGGSIFIKFIPLVSVGIWFLFEPVIALSFFIIALSLSFPALRPYSDTLQVWRVTSVLSLLLSAYLLYKNRRWVYKLSPKDLKQKIIVIWQSLPVWKFPLLIISVITLLGLVFGLGYESGVSRLIFIFNASIFAVLLLLWAKNFSDLEKTLKALFVSSSIILFLGYFQFVFASLMPIYYFWQYWAEVVARNILGSEIASVLWYSNSWFTVNNGNLVLRMFSVMPDSHSFGLICVFGLVTLSYLLNKNWFIGKKTNLLLMYLFSVGLVFSGTRGVWASMLSPAIIFVSLYLWKKSLRSFLKPQLIAIGMVILAFASSPLIRLGMHYAYSGISGDYIGRVRSIYDTNETSNAGRLAIWKESLVLSVKYPLGVGLGNFTDARIGKQKNNEEKINLRYNLPEKYITAHSLYLQILVELGFLGLISFGAFIFFYLKNIYSSFILSVKLSKVNEAGMLSAMGMLFLWLIAFSVFDVTILNDKILIFTLLCLAVTSLTIRKIKAYA